MVDIKISKDIFFKKSPNYTFTVLFFLIFSVFVIFAIRPSLLTLFALKKDEIDLKKINSVYEEKILTIADIQLEMEKNRDKLPLLDQAISIYPQVNKMIEDIKTVADENSFSITKLTVSDINLFAAKKKDIGKIIVTVEGKCSFENLLKFTDALFNQRRLKMINKLVINSDPESTSSSQLKIALDVEGYYL